MISVQSKKLLFTLIFIIIFSFPIMAKDRVAIVGNSQAYYLSKLLKIDDDKDTIQRTNNAVWGSYIWSKDPEIKDFPKRAKKYDYGGNYKNAMFKALDNLSDDKSESTDKSSKTLGKNDKKEDDKKK